MLGTRTLQTLYTKSLQTLYTRMLWESYETFSIKRSHVASLQIKHLPGSQWWVPVKKKRSLILSMEVTGGSGLLLRRREASNSVWNSLAYSELPVMARKIASWTQQGLTLRCEHQLQPPIVTVSSSGGREVTLWAGSLWGNKAKGRSSWLQGGAS